MIPTPKRNWKRIALLAWSQWALYASLAVQAADALMPYWLDYSSPAWLKGTAFGVTVLAAYVKLLPQKSLAEEEPQHATQTPE